MKITQSLKAILLGPTFYVVPERFRSKYWVLLSGLRKFIYGGNKINKIETVHTPISLLPGSKIYMIEMSDGKVFVQSMSRVSRFIGGRDRALRRILDIYLDSEELNKIKDDKDILVVDVGANIGEFTLALLQVAPQIKLIAIEPDPVAFECLRRNLQENEAPNFVQSNMVALSDIPRDVDFYLASEEADSSLVRPNSSGESILLKTTNLDTILSSWPTIDKIILKMDAEGHEPEVLVGGLHSLSRIVFLTIDVGAEREGMDTEYQVKSLLESFDFTTRTVVKNQSRLILKAQKSYV